MNLTSPRVGSRRRTYKRIFIGFAVAGLALLAGIAIFVFVFSDMLLNRYAKGNIERVFAEAYPGYVLRIGSIHYNAVKNYTECRAVSIAANDSTLLCSAGSLSASEIGWKQLISERELTPGVVKQSVLKANDVVLRLPGPGYEINCAFIRISIPDSEITAGTVSMDFAESRYQLRCGNLRASAADSELSAEGVEFRPLAGDDDFFAASAYKRTRMSLSVRQCYLRRAPVYDLLQGKSLKAGTLDIFHAEVDMLVNRDKPSDRASSPPLMPGEALGRLGRAVRLDSLAVHNASLTYGERRDEKGKFGTLTFDSVQLSVLGIGNAPRDTVAVRGRGRFMAAGVMNVVMNIPMAPGDLSLSYHGSLTSMDLTTLNRFLESAEHTRVTSGYLHDASFDVHVAHGRASGSVRANYNDLYITMLDTHTGSAIVFGKQIATLLANIIKIRGSNIPDKSGSMNIGAVKYTRKHRDTFMNVAWFSLRSGVGDVVGF